MAAAYLLHRQVTNDEVIVAPSDTSLGGFLDQPGFVKALVGVLTLTFAACLAVAAIVSLFPPAVDGSVPPSEFSAIRARDYLKPIAQKPHPIGSAAHAEVRDYITGELTKLGLQPQVQRSTAINTFWGYPNRAATAENESMRRRELRIGLSPHFLLRIVLVTSLS